MRHSTLALMLLVLQFIIVLKIPVEAGLLSLSHVLQNFCCHRISFSYGMIYLQNWYLNEWFWGISGRSLRAVRIHHLSRSTGPCLIRQPIWLSFSSVYDTNISIFLFYAVRRLKQSKVNGFALGYLGVVGELGTKPFWLLFVDVVYYIKSFHREGNIITLSPRSATEYCKVF